MPRQLLVETFGIGDQPEELQDRIIEKKKLKDNIYLTGIIQRAETLNGNNRIYPKRLLEREMNIYERFIRENRSVGELDHPDRDVAHLREASHILEEYWWDGDGKTMIGRMRVLRHTPNGKILEGLLDDGVRVGVSSRALGSVLKTPRGNVVDEDLMLICFDVVANPSTTGAFPIRESFLVRESLDPRIFELTKEDKINRLLNEIMYMRGVVRK